MPLDDLTQAANTVAEFLRSALRTAGFRLRFRLVAGEGAADPDGLEARQIYVEFAGPDAPLLLANKGELLRSLEHLSAKLLRLDANEHDRISFDADNFKAGRARELRETAYAAASRVRSSGEPFVFNPMSSRERRLLHLALRDEDDLETASAGEGSGRVLIVYPKGFDRALFTPPTLQDGYGRRDGHSDGHRRDGHSDGHRSRRPRD